MLNVVLILISSFLWSTSFPVIKYALKFSDPLDLLYIRFAFASFFAALMVLASDKKFSILKNGSIALLGFLNTLGFICQFFGQRLTTSSNASVLSNTSIIFTAFLAIIILKEKISLKKAIAGLLAITGVTFISTGFRFELSSTTRGDLLVLISAICWAIFTIFNKVTLSNSNARDIVLGAMIWTFLFLIPYSPFIGKEIHLNTLLIGLYLSLFCSIIPLYLFNLVLKKLGAYSTVVYLSTEIIFAVTLSIIFLKEALSIPFVTGSILILIGIYLNPQK